MAFNQAIALDTNNGWAWHGKGCVLRDLKQYQEALSSYIQVTELIPDYKWGWHDKGNVLHQLERHEEAIIASS